MTIRRWRLIASSLLVACAGLPASLPAMAQAGASSPASSVRIRTSTGSEAELAAQRQLERILVRYPLQRWIYTRDVLIRQGVIPHSHPVLTLNARPDGDEAKLATFVHEQFHWYLEAHPRERDAAIAEFERLFPDAPAGGPRGARDRNSTWLHLIVCDLELQAMAALVGETRARELLGDSGHYTWIYAQVLDNSVVREVNARHGLLLPH